jgi:hypothetical protein
MDTLRDELIPVFETGMSRYVSDPWKARDDYIDLILDRSIEKREAFLTKHAIRPLSGAEKTNVLKLLEMQRHAMLMFTSCGWFFDDISGIESLQVMRYACRAMQLAREVSGINPEPQYIGSLLDARSNNPAVSNGAEIYLRYVQTSMVDIRRIVFNYGLSLLTTDRPGTLNLRHYEKREETISQAESGEVRMVAGTITLCSELTCEEDSLEYVVLHLGNYDFMGGVREFQAGNTRQLEDRFRPLVTEADIPRLIALMEEEFGTSTFSLWHLFKDGQRDTLFRLMDSTLSDLESSFRQIHRQNITLIHAMREMHIPIPKVLEDPVWYILNVDLNNALLAGAVNRQKVRTLVTEMTRMQFVPDRSTLNFTASGLITGLVRSIAAAPEDHKRLEEVIEIFTILSPLGLNYEIWECQNDYFYTGRKQLSFMRQKKEKGDPAAGDWVRLFRELGTWLGVRVV